MLKIFCALLCLTPLWAKQVETGLERLIQGSKQYASEQEDCALEEHEPFCAILSCSDARVPPELILGQEVGDVFVVRVAGNVVTPATQESLGYAIKELKVPTIVVMGHENCGAVKGVVKGELKRGILVRMIRRAIRKEKDVTKAIKTNAIYQAEQLRKAFPGNDVEFIPAYYNVDTCQFEVLDDLYLND